MFPVPIGFVEKNVHNYQQTCKRAKNFLDFIVGTRYTISEKKWFRTVHYEVNIFGEIKHKFGTTEHVLERMLDMDYISPSDYQLLKFYDMSIMVDEVIRRMFERKVDNLIPVSPEEMQLLFNIGTFIEDPDITKEDILSGEELR